MHPTPIHHLPSFTGRLPNSENPCWRKALTKDEIRALDKPLNLLERALECGLSGVVTSHLFISRRVQPAKLRVHPLSLYSGEEDPTRESVVPLSEKEITDRLEDLFATGTDLSMSNRPAPLDATTPLPLVSNHGHLLPLAYSHHLLLTYCFASRSLRSHWAYPSTLSQTSPLLRMRWLRRKNHQRSGGNLSPAGAPDLPLGGQNPRLSSQVPKRKSRLLREKLSSLQSLPARPGLSSRELSDRGASSTSYPLPTSKCPFPPISWEIRNLQLTIISPSCKQVDERAG